MKEHNPEVSTALEGERLPVTAELAGRQRSNQIKLTAMFGSHPEMSLSLPQTPNTPTEDREGERIETFRRHTRLRVQADR